MDPARDRMTASLRQWCETAAREERREVILRPSHATDLASATRDIEAHGGRVQSAGAGAITVIAPPATVKSLAELDWVRAVEEPRRLFTRTPRV